MKRHRPVQALSLIHIYNLFETSSKEWMLVTAGTKDKFNTMTANWGGTGFLWNRPVAFIFIRPERYTFCSIKSNV